MPQLEAIVLLEHQKLSNENVLLKEQIFSLEELNKIHIKTDSLKSVEVNDFKEKVASDEKTIEKLKTSKKKIIIGSSIGGILLFILGLIL